MKRILLLACLAIALASTGRVPTDEARLNAYVEGLRQGRVDLRMWERVQRRWRDMAE